MRAVIILVLWMREMMLIKAKYLCACAIGANSGPKDTKRPKKTQLPLLKSQEQKTGAGSKSRVLRMAPALNTTKAWAEHT